MDNTHPTSRILKFAGIKAEMRRDALHCDPWMELTRLLHPAAEPHSS